MDIIIIYALRLFPFLLFRLPNKPGVISENWKNPVSHLFVTVIPSSNALSMCGILSLSVLWCLNLLGTLDIKLISCTFVITVGMNIKYVFIHSLVNSLYTLYYEGLMLVQYHCLWVLLADLAVSAMFELLLVSHYALFPVLLLANKFDLIWYVPEGV